MTRTGEGRRAMADFTGLIESMKKAALDAVNASKPMKIVFGCVESAAPLVVGVDQKLRLEARQLVLPRWLTDFELETGHETLKVYNALREGDDVILLQMQGGQRYIVLDRLG